MESTTNCSLTIADPTASKTAPIKIQQLLEILPDVLSQKLLCKVLHYSRPNIPTYMPQLILLLRVQEIVLQFSESSLELRYNPTCVISAD